VKCPACGGRLRVVDVRPRSGSLIKRRRECMKCGMRRNTWEELDLKDHGSFPANRGDDLQQIEARTRARQAVRHAIARGDLVRPKICSNCGLEKFVEGHHADYSKPLEVVWLCKKCHYSLHSTTSSAQPSCAT